MNTVADKFMSALGVILIQILISCQIGSIQSAPLSSYLVSSFTPPVSDFNQPLNHIAINNITGDIYIGARERLFQLDSDLNLKEAVDTGKCYLPNEDNINDNKLLITVVTPQNYTLIICGGCGNGCQIRNLANISLDVRYPENTGDIVATGPGDLRTVGVVALGTKYESNGNGRLDRSFYLFNGISGQANSGAKSFISKRSIAEFGIYQELNVIKVTDLNGQGKFAFKHLLSYKDYLYYFISRGERTYLGRICRDSSDDEFESYTEIELQCSHGGSQNIIQSAYIGPGGSQLAESMNINTTDDLLYAIFSSSPLSSLCVYKIIDVQQGFEDAILGCILGKGTGTENSFLYESKCEKISAVTKKMYI
ncbi:plexin-B2-like [Lytechinus variegatus]|uniref:plexin-B2-like n=1 Tax=Lytechinus variegatus TaxID=7654 RepID=UPI001BB17F8B|nr:plexin-B2-like [Lytechinus variegatus]